MSDRFPCPCCRHRTLAEERPGTFAICPVCGGEDDDVQFRDPSFEGGASAVSLTTARSNYASTGASSAAAKTHVRPPTAEERAR